MCSYLVEEQSLGYRPNKHVLLAPQWNLNSLLWIRLMKKLNGSEISQRIFHSILAQICWTICIHCEIQAAIGRAGTVMYNKKSRHIRRRHNTIRQLLSIGIITIDYVKSSDNVSDPLTKSLVRETVERSSKGMGLRLRTSKHDGNSIQQIGDPKSQIQGEKQSCG